MSNEISEETLIEVSAETVFSANGYNVSVKKVPQFEHSIVSVSSIAHPKDGSLSVNNQRELAGLRNVLKQIDMVNFLSDGPA